MGEANFAQEACEKIQRKDGRIILENFSEVVWSCVSAASTISNAPAPWEVGRYEAEKEKKIWGKKILLAQDNAKEFALGTGGKRTLKFASLYITAH